MAIKFEDFEKNQEVRTVSLGKLTLKFIDCKYEYIYKNGFFIETIIEIAEKFRHKNKTIYIINSVYFFDEVEFGNREILVLSIENIFHLNFKFLTKLFLLFVKWNIHETILPILLPIHNIIFSKHKLKKYLREGLFVYVTKDLPNKNRKYYAMLSNDLKRENILNFPSFFPGFLHCFKDFITVKKERKYLSKKNFCAFIFSNSEPQDRIKFFKKLSKYKKIDSFGPLFNNEKIPQKLIEKYKYDNVGLEQALKPENHFYTTNIFLINQELFRDYKFVICFENSYANDYITEKLPNVMMANSIGIYRGAPNVGEFFNTKSFINYNDYKSDDKMIEKIIELDQDDKKYQEFKARFI